MLVPVQASGDLHDPRCRRPGHVPRRRDGLLGRRVCSFIVVGVATTGEEKRGRRRRGLSPRHHADGPEPSWRLGRRGNCRRLTADELPSPRPGVAAVVDDDETVLAALHAGAAGSVVKGSSGEEIAAAARTAASGGAVFDAGIAARILASSRRPQPARALRLADRWPAMGSRHDRRGILAARGCARALSMSLKTVQNSMSTLLDKLQVQPTAPRPRSGRTRAGPDLAGGSDGCTAARPGDGDQTAKEPAAVRRPAGSACSCRVRS